MAGAEGGLASSSFSAGFEQRQQPRRRSHVSVRRTRHRHSSTMMMSVQLETAAGQVDGQQKHAYEVVFVRHGQSTWNKANRFIGWTDAELTEEGEIEARVAGQVNVGEDLRFTSDT